MNRLDLRGGARIRPAALTLQLVDQLAQHEFDIADDRVRRAMLRAQIARIGRAVNDRLSDGIGVAASETIKLAPRQNTTSLSRKK